MAGDSFTHLHVHTEFSMLDGAARVPDLVAKAAADGQPAVGITDHGNMYGVLDFYQACVDAGVKPVIGCELYQAFEHRDERPQRRSSKQDDGGGDAEGGRKAYYHVTALAENDAGYRNLIQLASRAYLEGYYMKPKVDWELLDDHHDGLIVTSGCLGGQVLQALVPTPIMDGDRTLTDSIAEDVRFKNALEIAGRFQDIFGRDNFFIELQDHGIGAQAWSNPKLLELAKKLRAPLLATNDSHYTDQHDHEAHDALLCVQTASLMSDTNRFKFHGDQHYFKTAAEMRRLFTEIPEACDNTLWIAERANVEIEFGGSKLPDFPLPDGFATDSDYLRQLTFEGARERWGDHIPDEVTERLAYELKIIGDMGFSSYFLIVWDLIKHARDRDIRVGPGRGSAAGCAVSYCLRITDLDPVKYDLMFERFLNTDRISMPDIDMDFDSRGRDEMIRYAAERYGRNHVAQIVTFSTIKARAAVRDAARVLGYPYVVGDKVAKAMPPLIMGRDTPLWACMADEPPEKYLDGFKMATDLRQMYHEDPDAKKVIDVAQGLEGLRRQDGIHAAAVVITRDPLTEYLPIQRKPEPGAKPESAPVVTQYEMGGVEALGLLKMDFLGLRNLDVISDTVALIARTRGIAVDIDDPPLEDPATFELLQQGDTIGVFQLESPPMRALLQRLRPTEFGDVAAVIALYRPGPMSVNMHLDYADRKNGRKQVELFHPDAAELLADTQGLMIYQESVLRVAQKFAGYTLAEADKLRKACGKKNRELMAKEREKFVVGCEATGYGRDLGNSLFDVIEKFADYAFGKSHTFGYGLVTYQTAYLKANFPVEYFACLLTSVKGTLEKAAVYLSECRVMGIAVLVPDVNVSQSDFVAVIDEADPDGADPTTPRGRIPFGLSAVRNVGEGLVELLVRERDANGPFVDFFDFCDRVDLNVLNKRTIESLIKAGAFDSMGYPRQGLLMVYESIIDRTTARRRKQAEGQFELFDMLAEAPAAAAFDDSRIDVPTIDFDKKTRLTFEREMLGLYVSDHPLMGSEATLRRRTDGTLSELEVVDDGSIRMVGGLVTNLQRKWTKKGDLMAVFILEDLQGAIETMVFPKSMETYGHLLDNDAVVVMKCRVDKREDTPKLIAMEIEVLADLGNDASGPVRLKVHPSQATAELLERLKAVLIDHPGSSQVLLELGDKQVLRLPERYAVDYSNGLKGALHELLGADAVLV